MSLEVNLAAETRKWLVKAEDLFADVSGEEHFLENISAYIRDSHYFLENGDLIRAFVDETHVTEVIECKNTRIP